MKSMLVVEDDLLSQKIMKKIFQKDFEIYICDSAEEFYEKYTKVKFDIIIIDISLKGNKHGLELIKEFKSSSDLADTPVICLTAHVQMKTRKTAIEAGSDLFLTKPVSNQILKKAVFSLVK